MTYKINNNYKIHGIYADYEKAIKALEDLNDETMQIHEVDGTECRTLDNLCSWLNELNEDFPLDFVNKTIEKNGWEDLQGGNDWDICTDGKEVLTITESGNYNVVERL